MYSAENYHWGLVGYYLGCILLMLFLYRFRKLVPGRHFRNLLLLLIAAIFLVPVTAYPDTAFLAPAWFVSIFETITEDSEQAYMRGLQPVIVCYLAAVAIYLLWAIFGPRKPVVSKHQTDDLDTETESETV